MYSYAQIQCQRFISWNVRKGPFSGKEWRQKRKIRPLTQSFFRPESAVIYPQRSKNLFLYYLYSFIIEACSVSIFPIVTHDISLHRTHIKLGIYKHEYLSLPNTVQVKDSRRNVYWMFYFQLIYWFCQFLKIKSD